MNNFTSLAALVFLCLVPSVLNAEEGASKRTFEQLKTLVGDWTIADSNRKTQVNFRLIANDSAIVETWTMSPTRQSMTVYVLDGERLIMTHYCPQGNAPRLVHSKTDDDGVHHFQFLDGANLRKKDGEHQHAGWIRIDSATRFQRSDTYIENGTEFDPAAEQAKPHTFVRETTP